MLARRDTGDVPRGETRFVPAGASALDRALLAASRGVRLLAAVTPENLRERRAILARALARGERAPARFTYAPAPRGEVRRALDAIALEVPRRLPPALAALYLARVEELSREARIAEATGSGALAPLARARFAEADAGVRDRADALALEWLAAPPPPDAPRARSDSSGPGSLLEAMRREVGARRLPFSVETSPTLQSRAATGDRTIWVAEGKLLTAAETARTVLHEIEGHAAPRARAATLPAIFSIGTAQGADDQEGYALSLEETAGRMDVGRRRELAARHRAVLAMEGGAELAEVATALVRDHGFGPDGALEVAERVFRGSDGSVPGLGRERVYLTSFVRVRAHLAGSPHDEAVLASGQVGVAWLASLPSR